MLVAGRKRLLGLFPYDTHTVDPAVRQELIVHLTGPEADTDLRAPVLARLLVRSGLHRRNRLSREDRARLESLSNDAPSTTPAPAGLDAVDLVMATVLYTTVISD